MQMLIRKILINIVSNLALQSMRIRNLYSKMKYEIFRMLSFVMNIKLWIYMKLEYSNTCRGVGNYHV